MPTDIIISCVFLLHINTPLTFFLRTASANLADLQIDLLQNHIISEPAAYSFALCMLFSGKKKAYGVDVKTYIAHSSPSSPPKRSTYHCENQILSRDPLRRAAAPALHCI